MLRSSARQRLRTARETTFIVVHFGATGTLPNGFRVPNRKALRRVPLVQRQEVEHVRVVSLEVRPERYLRLGVWWCGRHGT